MVPFSEDTKRLFKICLIPRQNYSYHFFVHTSRVFSMFMMCFLLLLKYTLTFEPSYIYFFYPCYCLSTSLYLVTLKIKALFTLYFLLFTVGQIQSLVCSWPVIFKDLNELPEFALLVAELEPEGRFFWV